MIPRNIFPEAWHGAVPALPNERRVPGVPTISVTHSGCPKHPFETPGVGKRHHLPRPFTYVSGVHVCTDTYAIHGWRGAIET